MSIKKSKVKAVTGNGNWEGSHGTMYSFEYEMEDGALFLANHKQNTPKFPVGTEAEYELGEMDQQNNQKATIKKVGSSNYTPSSNGSYSSAGVEVGHAINNAVLLGIHRDKTSIEDIKANALEIYNMAKEMRAWAEGQSKPEPKPETPAEPQPDNAANEPDDLPF